MATALQKTYSIVIRVENIQTLNGDLESVDDISQRERITRQFFVAQYGEGEGRLGVRLGKSKVKLSWFPPKADSQAEDLHVKALADAKDKNYRQAINSWVKAISINSADPDYYFNLGVAFFELKNYRESIENLQRSVQVCPIYYKSHLVLGTVFIKERKFTQAERHLRETLKFNPNIAFAYLNLGAVCSILKRYDEGIQMFTQSLKLSPNEVKALFGLGKIYSIIGDSEKANDYFTKLLQIDPTGPLSMHAKRAMVTAPLDEKPPPPLNNANSKEVEHLYQHAYRAYLFTDYDRSIEMYTEYVKRKSDDDFVWFSLAEAYLRVGMIEKAVECYEKAISLNSTKPLYFKELAIAFNYLNQEDEVINCLNKAKQLGKSDSLTHTLQGKILIKQKKFSEAIDNLTQAIKMNPNNLLAKYYLAVAFRKTNDVHSAINSLQEIMAAPIDSPLKVEAEGLLGELN